MKILALADLHFQFKEVSSIFYIEKLKRRFQDLIDQKPDLILIAGDIFESRIYSSDINPFEVLANVFNDIPIIFTLGNHEFAFKDFNEVKPYWSKFHSKNIHCLDIENKVQINNYTFVGNVFWYDFSLNKNRTLMKGEIVEGWLDETIKNFDPIKENEKCKDQIKASLNKTGKNILLTHMVPHISLNMFSLDYPESIYNAYSGCEDFLKDISDYNIEYVICGHTHRSTNNEIYGIKCFNIGNDYFFRSGTIKYRLLELE